MPSTPQPVNNKLTDFFAWFFNQIKEVGSQALILSGIENLPNLVSDLNEQEKKGLEDIINKFELKASLAGCNTEDEAFKAIAPSILDLPPEKQEIVHDALKRVLAQD